MICEPSSCVSSNAIASISRFLSDISAVCSNRFRIQNGPTFQSCHYPDKRKRLRYTLPQQRPTNYTYRQQLFVRGTESCAVGGGQLGVIIIVFPTQTLIFVTDFSSK